MYSEIRLRYSLNNRSVLLPAIHLSKRSPLHPSLCAHSRRSAVYPEENCSSITQRAPETSTVAQRCLLSSLCLCDRACMPTFFFARSPLAPSTTILQTPSAPVVNQDCVSLLTLCSCSIPQPSSCRQKGYRRLEMSTCGGREPCWEMYVRRERAQGRSRKGI